MRRIMQALKGRAVPAQAIAQRIDTLPGPRPYMKIAIGDVFVVQYHSLAEHKPWHLMEGAAFRKAFAFPEDAVRYAFGFDECAELTVNDIINAT